MSSTPTNLPLPRALADPALLDRAILISEYLCNWREDLNDFVSMAAYDECVAWEKK